MKIIGLTGPSGAGKSTLCEVFEKIDIPCINTDIVYHKMTSSPSPCLEELKKRFGNSIIDPNGALDRAALSKLVFEGENADKNLADLNSTTHKFVWYETSNLLTEYANQGKKAAVIDAPALFSSEIFVNACDFILSVLCDKNIRIERIMKRDGITYDRAIARINAQPDDKFFIDNSDYFIYNGGMAEEMTAKLLTILEQEEILSK